MDVQVGIRRELGKDALAKERFELSIRQDALCIYNQSSTRLAALSLWLLGCERKAMTTVGKGK